MDDTDALLQDIVSALSRDGGRSRPDARGRATTLGGAYSAPASRATSPARPRPYSPGRGRFVDTGYPSGVGDASTRYTNGSAPPTAPSSAHATPVIAPAAPPGHELRSVRFDDTPALVAYSSGGSYYQREPPPAQQGPYLGGGGAPLRRLPSPTKRPPQLPHQPYFPVGDAANSFPQYTPAASQPPRQDAHTPPSGRTTPPARSQSAPGAAPALLPQRHQYPPQAPPTYTPQETAAPLPFYPRNPVPHGTRVDRLPHPRDPAVLAALRNDGVPPPQQVEIARRAPLPSPNDPAFLANAPPGIRPYRAPGYPPDPPYGHDIPPPPHPLSDRFAHDSDHPPPPADTPAAHVPDAAPAAQGVLSKGPGGYYYSAGGAPHASPRASVPHPRDPPHGRHTAADARAPAHPHSPRPDVAPYDRYEVPVQPPHEPRPRPPSRPERTNEEYQAPPYLEPPSVNDAYYPHRPEDTSRAPPYVSEADHPEVETYHDHPFHKPVDVTNPAATNSRVRFNFEPETAQRYHVAQPDQQRKSRTSSADARRTDRPGGREMPSRDIARDRSPIKGGNPAHVEAGGGQWHRDPNGGDAEDASPMPYLSNHHPFSSSYDPSTRANLAPAGGVSLTEELGQGYGDNEQHILKAAAEIAKMRRNPGYKSVWERNQDELWKRAQADLRDEEMNRKVDTLQIEPRANTPGLSFVLRAEFLKDDVDDGRGGGGGGGQGYDAYDAYGPGEEEEEEEEEELKDVQYHHDLMVFREQMAYYRQHHPEEYPGYLTKVLASGLPREHHEYFRREMTEIRHNHGMLPEYRRLLYRREKDAEERRKKEEEERLRWLEKTFPCEHPECTVPPQRFATQKEYKQHLKLDHDGWDPKKAKKDAEKAEKGQGKGKGKKGKVKMADSPPQDADAKKKSSAKKKKKKKPESPPPK